MRGALFFCSIRVAEEVYAMADYPVKDGTGATIIPFRDYVKTPHDDVADYPVLDGNGNPVVQYPFDLYAPQFTPAWIKGCVAWYDASDLSTMFQADGAGQADVASSGDPVGLVLDKSQGLAKTSYTGVFVDYLPTGFTDEGDGVYGAAPVTDWASIEPSFEDAVQAGEVYRIEADVVLNSGFMRVYRRNEADTGNDVILTATASGAVSATALVYRSKTAFLSGVALWLASNDFDGTVSNVRCYKIAGNHLYQDSAAARPAYGTDGTTHWLDFDGVDDYLVHNSRLGLSGNPALTLVGSTVSKQGGGTAGRVFSIGDNTFGLSGEVGQVTADAGISWRYDGGNSQFGPIVNDVPHVITWKRSALSQFQEAQMFYDGSERALLDGSGAGLVPTNTGERFTLGARYDAGVPLDGSVYEMVVLNRDLPTVEREAVEAYMARQAGVTL